MSGIFGINNSTGVALDGLAYAALHALQHRGQDGAGVSVSNGETIRYEKDLGVVDHALPAEKLKKFADGKLLLGHVRYSPTSDAGNGMNTEPVVVTGEDGPYAACHNGKILNSETLRKKLQQKGALFQTGTDSELLLYMIAIDTHTPLIDRIKAAMAELAGAYSFAVISKDKLIGIRDPWGIRPLCIGMVEGNYVLASESCAINALSGTIVRDVLPGEIVVIDENGITSHQTPVKDENNRLCVFEYVYYARSDSVMDEASVFDARFRMGGILADMLATDADVVSGVPDSGVPAAIGYAHRSGIPYTQALIKNPYSGRTFIQPGQLEREQAVRLKLTPVASQVKGKRVVLVDDSIVRGTNLLLLVRMLRAAGAKEVHVRITSPQVMAPCLYGIDTPNSQSLIGANMDIAAVCKAIEADSLVHLDLDSLRKSVSNHPGYCTACFNYDYPVTI